MQTQEVAPGVHMLVSAGIVNWYLVVEDGRAAAVDAGFPPDWDALVEALRGLGRDVRELEAVVLTHGHIDHIGFAKRAQRETGARVYVHPGDEAIVRSPTSIARSERNPLRYVRHAPTRRLFLTALARRAPLGKGVSDLTMLEDGETLGGVPGQPTVVATPGHTDGSVSLHLRDRGVLFSGDALVTVDPYTGLRGPRLVARAATADVGRALASLGRIAETGADTVLPGHGAPWTDGAAAAAERAAAAGSA
jgi:glyoxylase-like metal-dependent hydrolase (beta-lactamase superfamily II)